MTRGLCRHGIPYQQKCQKCINRALFWKNRNAALARVDHAGSRPADPPSQEGQKP